MTEKKQCGFFALAFCLFAASPVFAVQYWGNGAFAGFGYASGVGIQVPLEAEAGIRYAIPKAELYAAGSLNGFSANITASVLVEPLTFGVFSLGLKYVFHAGGAYPGQETRFCEIDNNLYLSLIFRGKNSENPFKLALSCGLDAKTSWFGLSSGTLILQENFLSMELQIQKKFLRRHEIMFRLATFDYSQFKVYLNTWWQLGYSYDITPSFTAAALFQIAYADQITNSGTIDGFQVKLAGAYRFKQKAAK